MWSRNFDLFSKAVAYITACFLITACLGGELSETEAFFSFIRAVDPENVLGISLNGKVTNPCSYDQKGVKCNLQETTITEIRLESLNLSGVIDADSLCKLQNLQVLSLSKNLICGNIPDSISTCRRLAYLDLSHNLLSGKVPLALTKLKHLRILDISNNNFTGSIPLSKLEFEHPDNYSLKETSTRLYKLRKLFSVVDSEATDGSNNNMVEESSQPPTSSEPKKEWYKQLIDLLPFIIGIAFIILFFLVVYSVTAKVTKVAKEKELLKSLARSPQNNPPPVPKEEVKPDEGRTELVFFVEEQETFKMDDLFEATADLQSHTLYSSLYKVMLKNNGVYAVKRLKKLQVSLEEFGQTMRQIGSLKHPNILPLVGYNSTNEEKLIIYKYQSNGSLLNLIEDHIEGKRSFPWTLRLSIASGIARGLEFIYQNSHNQDTIPHGNLKSSNILLNENEEPLISEYGFSRFLDSKKPSLYISNGYTAPEKTLSEQGDVFSFGIILLELLTGKTVEKSGIDLPKWVRSMVREEWTGEVFDKEVNNAAREYAFPLLNIALKCVSNSPEDRPTMAEIMEKIEEIANGHDDVSISSMASIESSPQDCCLLHTVIPETWDTPASNY
ncbi:probable inactive receptor kinase At5g53320 [Ricinus communis]|uniref:probable inactive receptor kinase At5g53320 n=1 Tax=Ricinus communis TaxID=3988 RepID=UPI00201AD426|nr:probable inactive receptor kinase At5g53320 [Ricinus communis]XP_048235630.1 probable inactive receptor kinase At5g53320 [Ricinus communis]